MEGRRTRVKKDSEGIERREARGRQEGKGSSRREEGKKAREGRGKGDSIRAVLGRPPPPPPPPPADCHGDDATPLRTRHKSLRDD